METGIGTSAEVAAAAIQLSLTFDRESERAMRASLGEKGFRTAAIVNKAIGLNVGGKIGIVREGEHVGVAMFFRIGLLNLNEVAIGLGHRAL